MPDPRRRIAVIGAGVAGLTAAHVLQRSTDVTLFEAADRLGGHADTHDVDDARGALAVDTGFIVHNEKTYPTLLRLFAELGVATQDSDMSMSVRCEGCGLQYAGARGLAGLFAQPRSLTRGRYLRMLGEVVRFHRQARAALLVPAGADVPEQTIAEFVAAGGYSTYFGQHFLTPVISAVWSCAPASSGGYPARYLFAFLANHGMLAVTGSPTWKTVVGGSRSYVEKAAKGLTAVRTGTPVRALRRGPAGVLLTDGDGESHEFDAAVVATHPGQALSMLAEPTAAEAQVLGAFSYTRNPTVLHTDARLLPTAPRARASWNYVLDHCGAGADNVLVSYDMTRLQRLPTGTTYVVTLNGDDRIDPASVLARMDYEHPTYNVASVAAQRQLPGLNDGVLAFAGAYHGWGFHEDGARSGLAAAQSLGGAW